MKAYVYNPTEAVDLGFLGQHFLTLTALIDIDYESNSMRRSVSIMKAVVTVVFGDLTQELDITPVVVKDNYSCKDWEDEIYKDWLANVRKEYGWESPA